MRTRRHPSVLLLLAVLAMLVAGCGSGNDDKSSATSGTSVSAADSMLSQANLTKGLDALRKRAGSKANATTVKIDPLTVTATVLRKNKFTFYTVDKGLNVQTSSAPPGAVATFKLRSLDPAVPAKLLAEMSSKYGKKLEDIDSVVLVADPFSKTPVWTIFVKGGKDGPYQADLDGSNLATAQDRAKQAATTPAAQPPGVPGGPAVPGSTTPNAAPPQLPANIKKLQECVAKANGDQKKVAGCIKSAMKK